ncbi:MAG: alpha/beta fold hydrolase [Flavobacteriales bacterium]
MRTSFIIATLAMTLSTSISAQTKGTSLRYLVRQPTVASAHPPLLVLLHGVGSNERDLFSFADRLPGEYLVISARAPITLGPDSYAWYQVDLSTGAPVIKPQEAEHARTTLITFIEELGKAHSFDPQRVVLCGFSQGAIMSYSVALTRPDLVHGIAVMSGRLLEEVKPMVEPSPALTKLKVFISHGTLDATLPVHYANEANTYLRTLGISPGLKTYPEGHTISAAMLEDLVRWLEP